MALLWHSAGQGDSRAVPGGEATGRVGGGAAAAREEVADGPRGVVGTVRPCPARRAPTTLPPVWRNRGVCAPRALYIAVRTNEIGVVVEATGPFLDQADAQTCVENDYGGQGYPVPFTLAMHSP